MDSHIKVVKNMYITKPGNYYAEQMRANGLRSFWFRQRQYITRRLVKKYFKGGLVLDIGCGNCLWNNEGIPAVGIDICESMLKYNMVTIPSFVSLRADVFEGLPIRNSSADMVIITELLEHIPYFDTLIEEIRRVLRKGGIVISSVPYSKFPGLWGLIFPLWCKYKGWRDKDEYYLTRCGHKVNFNFKKIHQAFNKFMFLESSTLGFLTIFFVTRKV